MFCLCCWAGPHVLRSKDRGKSDAKPEAMDLPSHLAPDVDHRRETAVTAPTPPPRLTSSEMERLLDT